MMRKLGIATLLVLFTTSVQAAKMYATIGGGFSIPGRNLSTTIDSNFAHYGPTATPSGESFFYLPGEHWQYNFKNGGDLNAAIGYNLFSSWRAELEFLYQRFNRDIGGTYGWAEYDALSAQIFDHKTGIQIVPTTAPVNVYSIFTNAYFDYHNHTKWTPLLGAGFGITWVKSKTTSANGQFTTGLGVTATTLQNSPPFSGTAFAWQLKVGTAYEYSKAMEIVMQYRLFITTAFIAEPSSIVTNPDSGPATRRVFRIAQQNIHGLIINCLELQLKFNFLN